MANGNFFPMSHFKAVLKRRSIMIKRSVKSIISSIIGAMIFSIFVIGIYWLMMSLMKSKGKVVSFDRYKTDRPDLVFIGNSHLNDELAPHLAKMQLDESGLKSTINKYQDVNTFNDQLYDNFSQSNFYLSIPFGININRDSPTPYDISLLYNSTPNTEYETTEELNMIAFVNLNRAIWKMELGEDKDFEVINHPLTERSSQSMFGYIGPLLIICGLLTVIPLIMTQPNTDIQGETRSFMQSCTLKLAPYWVATFLIDFCIWVIITTLMWGVFNIGMIVAFHDNLFNSWYALVMAGPSFILFIYVLAFIFKKPDSASRQAFLILVLTILIPLIVQMLRQKPNPIALDWIYSLFPHIALQQLLGYMLGNVGSAKQNLSYYFKWTHSMPLLIMQIVDIPIYIIIITIIEATRTHIQRKLAKMSFGGYSDFFKQAKSKHFVSQEALVMENEVHLSHDYAVRVEDVSRLFINTAGEPIPAVNNVSLGVKEGSLFGFLGANGAGKTTLIRMITGLLSASSGSIEIFGVPIEDVKDRTVLSICPQFNNHLFNELTPREHFQI
ncbi:ABC transporter family protein [Tritrichomonas foetus]|uniref:ABC transporter family protein n=1 Tax=Tritrichomonas foetus TaxID=1144522 RepID=A0A1J4K019_9EUKA|nr:ABC transporter family protein [Tritrichomonas foetus]|eukprot:OHT04579.1 ABC transporter family protein [Tritrichomonas foetus]